MDTLTTFFDMGGYAAFIWPCYGISAVLMLGLLLSSIRNRNKNAATLAKLENKD